MSVIVKIVAVMIMIFVVVIVGSSCMSSTSASPSSMSLSSSMSRSWRVMRSSACGVSCLISACSFMIVSLFFLTVMVYVPIGISAVYVPFFVTIICLVGPSIVIIASLIGSRSRSYIVPCIVAAFVSCVLRINAVSNVVSAKNSDTNLYVISYVICVSFNTLCLFFIA